MSSFALFATDHADLHELIWWWKKEYAKYAQDIDDLASNSYSSAQDGGDTCPAAHAREILFSCPPPPRGMYR